MISHLLVVAGNDGRMHPGHRRQFFRQIAALYRRHRPAGYLRPPGCAGLKHRLVAAEQLPAVRGCCGPATGWPAATREPPNRHLRFARAVASAPQPAQTASIR